MASKKKATKGPTQREHRRGVKVGDGMFDVSTPMYWYKHGHFKTDDEARGAFFLAYQQAMDGMGTSVAEWMGITEDELAAWMKDHTLPAKTKKKGRRS